MVIPTVIMGLVALIFLCVGYYKGQHINGMKLALSMALQLLPLLIFAFIVSGMIHVLMPKEVLLDWIGTKSGMRGILIGTVAGGFAIGGPYVSLPIAAGLMRSGASIGTIVAFLTGWSLWAISRLPMEFGILGWKVTLIRIISVFFFPPAAGLIAQALAKVIK